MDIICLSSVHIYIFFPIIPSPLSIFFYELLYTSLVVSEGFERSLGYKRFIRKIILSTCQIYRTQLNTITELDVYLFLIKADLPSVIYLNLVIARKDIHF